MKTSCLPTSSQYTRLLRSTRSEEERIQSLKFSFLVNRMIEKGTPVYLFCESESYNMYTSLVLVHLLPTPHSTTSGTVPYGGMKGYSEKHIRTVESKQTWYLIPRFVIPFKDQLDVLWAIALRAVCHRPEHKHTKARCVFNYIVKEKVKHLGYRNQLHPVVSVFIGSKSLKPPFP